MERPRTAVHARLSAAIILAACASTHSAAQPAPTNGPLALDAGWHALTGATLIPEPGRTIENATIVIRDGVIVSVREGAAVPDGAREWECDGLTIYAGLIDAYLPVDAPAPDKSAPGNHWNEKVIPQRSALDAGAVDAKTREALRKLGFTAAAIVPKGGIFRGTGAVITLSDDPAMGESARRALLDHAFDTVALESSGWGARSYPGSQMGAIALIRQTLHDARWREADLAHFADRGANRGRPAPADALDALVRGMHEGRPLFFPVNDELEALRAHKIAREFDRDAIIAGNGYEFRRLDAVAALDTPLIVPLNFPEAPKMASFADQEGTDLNTLLLWDQAPTNARRLAGAGVEFAITTDRLRNRNDFRKNLATAIERGLTSEQALAALTVTPAEILGVAGKVGRVAPGYAANLVVVDGDLFDPKSTLRDVWVDGRRHEINAPKPDSIDAEWTTTRAGETVFSLTLSDDAKKGKFVAKTPIPGMTPIDGTVRSVTRRENRVSFLLDLDIREEKLSDTGPDVRTVVCDALVEGDTMHLRITDMPMPITLTLTRVAAEPGDDAKDEKKRAEPKLGVADDHESFGYPFGAYGMAEIPAQRDVLLTGATIWTSGPAGVIENGALLVRGGKVVAVGKTGDRAFRNPPSSVQRIDATGKHITPGLIDAHSHTGISGGVNEGTHSATSEVRIADVIDPDAINFYRQIAGGLTAANQLHGSANTIGGQNSIVKLRWGAQHPDDMLIEGAKPGIKFALGENVKQSNWESDRTRYPQTRMGVETYLRDKFHAARDYAARRARNDGPPVRRDLQLDALVEILEGERLVHCHSYRQDEIFMLTQVAKDFGFRIGTFQHVLEGYKVAEAIKEHAIGASAFSDWWAFKMEVIDAIPENGAIMHEVGVNVSFNSDNDELARRMNIEAAKAVKYGGVAPAEALKFVTINPAIQLGIDSMTGSLEAGKDADFVVWSGDPLSTFTRCEATWIDGREYFSISKDRELRHRDSRLRDRLMQRILSENAKKPADGKKDAADETKEEAKPELAYDQRTLELLRETYLDIIRAGGDPTAHRCGECGVLDLHAGHNH